MKANELFEMITAEMIDAIEAGNAGAWSMPWHALAGSGGPVSVDGRPYRGLNAMWLAMVAAPRGWVSGRWGTYRAWQRHGAQVRKGERSTEVVLWKPVTTDDGDDQDLDEPAGRGRRLVARTYRVFAAEQCDGTESIIDDANAAAVEVDTVERIEHADVWFGRVAATVIHGGNAAFYRPNTDTIHLPRFDQFHTPAHYYSTRAHETIHWTGASGRCDRDLSVRFGSDAYAVEELVAEVGAALVAAHLGISAATRDDHTAYIAGWLRVLRRDPRALVTIASRAQTAVDWLAAHTAAAADAA